MKKSLLTVLSLLLCITMLLTACGGDTTTTTTTEATTTTTTTTAPGGTTTTTTQQTSPVSPQPTGNVTLTRNSSIICANAVAPTSAGYASYYMETLAVLEFQKALKSSSLHLNLSCVQASQATSNTGIDAKVDPTLLLNKWTITVASGNIVVRGGHYAALEAGLEALLPVLEQSNGKLASGYTNQGTVSHITLNSINQTYGSAYGATGNYRMVWSDEFSGSAIDFERWSFSDENPVKLGVDRKNSAYIEDGNLVVPAVKSAGEEIFHTSNLVTTFDTMNFYGGYLEMRAKVPFKGIGEWVSLWATTGRATLFKRDWWRAGNTGDPEKNNEGENKPGAFGVEVDIFEVFSSGTGELDPNIWLWYNGDRVSQLAAHGQGQTTYTVPDLASDYHVYSFYWNQSWMVFAIDGVVYMAVDMTETAYGDPYYCSPERSALSLRLQNDVFTPQYCQQVWGGAYMANATASYYSEFVIDYIRLYQCDSDILYLPEEIGTGEETYDWHKSYASYWVNP